MKDIFYIFYIVVLGFLLSCSSHFQTSQINDNKDVYLSLTNKHFEKYIVYTTSDSIRKISNIYCSYNDYIVLLKREFESKYNIYEMKDNPKTLVFEKYISLLQEKALKTDTIDINFIRTFILEEISDNETSKQNFLLTLTRQFIREQINLSNVIIFDFAKNIFVDSIMISKYYLKTESYYEKGEKYCFVNPTTLFFKYKLNTIFSDRFE